jgi:NADH dehydrogenase
MPKHALEAQGDPNVTTQVVSVFGGTGFLGRRIVRHLIAHGHRVRIASRHLHEGNRLFRADQADVEAVQADVSDEHSIAAALTDAWAAVNAVSLYVERGDRTFQSIHVEAAARLAAQARQAGLKRFVQVSGIGADPHSDSSYIRIRGQGELAVRREFPTCTIVRPAVMFGPDDAFLVPLMRLIRSLPVFPMFGRGQTRLQPVNVEDVAEAVTRILEGAEPQPTYEFGGPSVFTYEDLVRKLRDRARSSALIMPLPFSVWHSLGAAAELLPQPPVTRNQVELMHVDNVAWEGPGLHTLGIEPTSVDLVLSRITGRGGAADRPR